MSGNNDLEAFKIFGKFKPDFVCGFWRKLIVGTEGLDDVIVLSAVFLAVFLFDVLELVESCLGHTVDTRNQCAAVGLFSLHSIRKNVVHRAI